MELVETNTYFSEMHFQAKAIQNRSENCRKLSPANRRNHNWEPIHQSSMLRVTIDAIGQCG